MRASMLTMWPRSLAMRLSPGYSIARGLSAGRVQSVAVRLIVEREREIRAFVPEEYWEVHALLKSDDIDPVRFLVTHRGGQKFEPKTQAEAEAAVAAMRRGLHVYCEKPLTHTIGEARELRELCKAS